MIVECCQHMSLRTSQKAVADHVGSNPTWLAQPAASARLSFGSVLTSQHGAVFWNGNRQKRAISKFIFERLRDRTEVRFSPLFFILIGLCENVLHEKMPRTPLPVFFLPEIMTVLHVCSVQLRKRSPQDRLSEIAFMRVVQAGAFEKVRKDYKKERSGSRRWLQQGYWRKPISLRFFREVLVVWAIWCGMALSPLVLGYYEGYLWKKPPESNFTSLSKN